MVSLSTASLDILATTTFLGGAILLLAFALFSYMGVLGFPMRSPTVFYSGKHIVITGGSSGIGKETARLLIAAGASVTLVARNVSKLEQAASELKSPDEANAAAARVNIYSVDCADARATDAMVENVERQFGAVDILINSVGMSRGGYFEKVDTSHLQSQMEANYFTTLYPTHAFFKKMCSRREGHIVFVSSMAGLVGVFGHAGYCPAKFAVRGLAETLYYEAKPYGISVTSVYPPDTDTPGLAEERLSMPAETIEISEFGGLFSAEKVAKDIVNGVMRGKFRVTTGLIGWLLGILTAGLTPNVSVLDVVIVWITRAVTPIFIWDNNKVIRKGHVARFSGSAESKP